MLKTKATQRLPQLSELILDQIIELRDKYKLFLKVVAVTSKQNKAHNVMAYKRRDAIKLVLKEYEQIRKLVQVCDIKLSHLTLDRPQEQLSQ